MTQESKYRKIIKMDSEAKIETFGDIIIEEGIFIKGDVVANSGSVFLKQGAIIKGDVFASITVHIDQKANIIGKVHGFSVENYGNITGDVNGVGFFRSFGKSSGKIDARMVLLGEYGVHEGPIKSMCVKIDQEARRF